MPSERALLIKQRQHEALRRQQQEIEERDAVRKQKEVGIKASQPIQPITTPQTIHELFNSRYQPKTHQPPPQAKNTAEDARLKAYEQKRARFLAKKRAQMQSAIHIQPPIHNLPSNTSSHSALPPQHDTHQFQQMYNVPSSNTTFQLQHTQPHNMNQNEQQIYNAPSLNTQQHNVQHRDLPIHNTQHMPFTVPQPAPNTVQNIYEAEVISKPEKYQDEYVQHLDYNQYNDIQQNQLKPTQYTNDQHRKTAGNKPDSAEKAQFAPYTHSEMNINMKEEKRAKQEQYRNELMLQMNEQRQPTHTQQHQHNNYFGSSISPYKQPQHDVNELKRIKQEKYRNELLQQMKEQKIHNRQSYNIDPKHNDYFSSSTSPYKYAEIKEDKRAKQEKYRQELMEQMRQKQHHIEPSMHTYNKMNEIKQTTEVEEHRKYDYAKELEEQMKLKQLTKMAEKEKQILEDRKMLMGGGYFDGLGAQPVKDRNNGTPQNNMDSKLLYRMELDKQCKELQEKKMKEKLLHERDEFLLEDKIKRDRELSIKQKYKEDLDEQNKLLQDKRKMERYKQHEEDMRLESKIKNDREQIKKEHQDSMGIFGRDVEREKLTKARKQETYQQELKRQAEETKRIKKEKELKELEEEKRLEMKIQRELKQLEIKYKREKEMEANGGVANKSIAEQNIEIFEANKTNVAKKTNFANIQNVSHIQRTSKTNIPNTTNIAMTGPNVDLFVPNNNNMGNVSTLSHLFNVPNMQRAPQMNVHNVSEAANMPKVSILSNAPHMKDNKAYTFHENGASSERSPIIAQQHRNVYDNRPSTSKRVFQELLNLKQDLFENQQMIRKELEMHKQQINQQLATASSQNEKEKLEQSNSKTFQNELSEYHNKISSEISNLRNAIIEQQQRKMKQTQKRKQSRSSSSHQSPKPNRFDIDKNSTFIPCTVAQTPLLPQTTSTAFTTTSTYDCNNNDESRLNTGFTAFGVDEYLLKECKQNNEYLQSVSSTRMHTPNIYRIDSLEKEINMNQGFDTAMTGTNICEKSIRSKSDFLYSAMLKKEDEEEPEEHDDIAQHPDHDITEFIDDKSNHDNIVNKLVLKNKNRLNYFRSTTPLDSTRSLKIGLQKISDLLSETEKLNRNSMQTQKKLDPSIDLDNSLYELI